MLNVLIGDDHSIVRFGLKQIIADAFAPANITEAANFDEVVSQVGQKTFDLLILDINLPGGNNLMMLDSVRLRQPSIKILIFSAFDEKLYAIKYLQAGADGYLEKSSPDTEVKNAIGIILKNEKYMSANTRQQLLFKFSDNAQLNPLAGLSSREIDVMNLLTKGTSIARIAEMLNLHISTVSTYKTRVYAKLEVNNLVELLQKVDLYRIN